MKDKIPLSGIVVPLLYLFSAIACLFFSNEIYVATFNVIPVFDYEYNIISMAIWNFTYVVLIRFIYTKHQNVYLELIPVFALVEFLHFLMCIYIFYIFQTQSIVITGIIHLGLLYLFLYERKLFKR